MLFYNYIYTGCDIQDLKTSCLAFIVIQRVHRTRNTCRLSTLAGAD